MAVTSSASAESSHNRAVGAYPRPKQEISLPEYQASNLSHHLSSNLNDRYDYLVLLISKRSYLLSLTFKLNYNQSKQVSELKFNSLISE